MSNSVYPSAIQGLTFTVLRTPEFSTIVQKSPSGNELRIPQAYNPIWHFTLIYDFIFGNFKNSNNTMPYAPFTDLDTLVGFYLARAGQNDDFLWSDPKNNYVGPAIFSAPPAGNMLMNGSGLVVNAFNDVAGRGDYFHEASGTSEGQFLLLLGMLEAYAVTGSAAALSLAKKMLSGLAVLYRSATLALTIPATVDATHIFAPHWLFCVKSPFQSATIHYTNTAQFINGVATIPDSVALVRYVFQVASAGYTLVYQNPYSPLASGTSYAIASYSYNAGTATTTITLTDTSVNATLAVIFSAQDGP